jgi:predicted MFS family arabinose efflux permease
MATSPGSIPDAADGDRPRTAPAVWPLFVATFLLSASGGTIFPLLAELQEAHHLPTWGLGVISSLFFAGAVGGQLLLAPFADRGHARTMLLGGLIASVAGLVLFAVGSLLWQFALARLLEGVAAGVFLPAARSSLVRTDPARAGHLLGRFASAETGGFVFGPVVGTLVFTALGLRAPFLVLAAALVPVVVLVARAPLVAPADADIETDVEVGPAPRRGASVLAPLRLLRNRGVVVAVLLELAVFLPVGIYDSLWARYLDDRGASTMLIGVGLTLYGLPFVLTAPTGGRLADRLGPVRAATFGMLVVVPTTAAYGILAAPLVITAAALLEAVGNATAVPAAQTAMARSCPPSQLAAGQGLSGAVAMIGAGAAAAIAAPVYEALGSVWLFGGAAVLMAGLVVAARALDRRRGSPAVPHPAVPTSAAGPTAVGVEAARADVDTPVGPVPLDPR